MRDEKIVEAHQLVQEARRIAGFPALLHRFLDTAAEAIVIVDDKGRIVFFNRRASFLFGWLAEEVIDQPIEILLPDDLKLRHVAHRKGFMNEPYTRAMGANLDLQAKHKDGTTFSVLIDLHPEVGTDGTYVRAAIRRKLIVSAITTAIPDEHGTPISPPDTSESPESPYSPLKTREKDGG
jgi:PAS domain S-box-containing protein